ncbi:hypothetical protein [Altericroceibacterium endophyticum]|uniref:Secreted protein n=1 Tax=Altericroceibacterium endophyticum TaxID=1808508 RepID=A0A6I4T788_9SPHN|nr:hypothetical protein [Altericroceibacterium endophyticum]MXO66092.1 hypothetical protein [Altericroceibacterium endophyticum]
MAKAGIVVKGVLSGALALAIVGQPASAADFSQPHAASAYDASAETMHHSRYDRYDRYDRYGRYDRYDRYRGHRRHRGGIRTGDVIAGVAVLGAIAAIAASSSKNDRNDRDTRQPYPPQRSDARYPSNSGYESKGLDRAADICAARVEQENGRIGSVDEVNRNVTGWQVAGTMDNGRDWTCWIDSNGRVSDVEIGTSGRWGADNAPADDYAYPGAPPRDDWQSSDDRPIYRESGATQAGSVGEQYDPQTYAVLRQRVVGSAGY